MQSRPPTVRYINLDMGPTYAQHQKVEVFSPDRPQNVYFFSCSSALTPRPSASCCSATKK